MSEIRIFLEAGHGGTDPGAVKYVTEAKETIKYVKATGEYLRENYICTVYEDVSADSTHEISARANRWNATVLVSFHENAGKGDGFELFLYSSATKSLGEDIWKYVKQTGQNAHGEPIKYDPTLNVLRLTNMDAVLLEIAFVDNWDDIKDWNDAVEINKMAKAIGDALAHHYKLKKKTATKKYYSGTYPKLPAKGYFEQGDFGTQVKYLQRFLNWCIGSKLDADGIYGLKTKNAVKVFQKKYNLTVDDKFGTKCLAKAKTIKK